MLRKPDSDIYRLVLSLFRSQILGNNKGVRTSDKIPYPNMTTSLRVKEHLTF